MSITTTTDAGRLTLLAVLALIGIGGCAQTQTGVKVVGSEEDVALLEGEWIGTFTNRLGQRTGTIGFSMSGEDDTAYGDVRLASRPRVVIGGGRARKEETPRLLAVTYIAISGLWVRGSLEAYRDPECGCAVETTFEGLVRRNAIEGTFLMMRTGTDEREIGAWRAERIKGTQRNAP